MTVFGELAAHASHFTAGLLDALKFWRTFIFIYSSSVVRNRFIKCFLLNVILFVGSVFLLNHVMKPAIGYIVTLNAPGDDLAPLVSVFERIFVDGLYLMLWLYPVYGMSFVLNLIWYQEIATQAYHVYRGTPQEESFNYERWVGMLADEIYRFLLFATYLVLVSLLSALPVVGYVPYFFGLSWMHAFYSFDYKWCMNNVDLRTRLNHFETHWSYFAGFGFPCTLWNFLSPQFISYGVYAFVFPFFIILAVSAKPRRSKSASPPVLLPDRVPIFHASKAFNALFLRRFSENL